MDDKSSQISTRVPPCFQQPVRLAARMINRAGGSYSIFLLHFSSFLTLLRFRCPEEPFLAAFGVSQSAATTSIGLPVSHCHRVPLAYPKKGGVAPYRAALENPKEFSSNISGVKVARWSDKWMQGFMLAACTDTE